MAKYKVEVDPNTCIGCRACTVICDNFVPNGDKVKVVNAIVESDIKKDKEAEESCPVGAIKVTKLED